MPKAVRAGLEELAPHLLGENPLHLDQINARMDVMLPGHPYVKAAIDLACWDILGKHCQLPVYALLGGRFQASIALQSSIPTADTEQMATIWPSLAAKGIAPIPARSASGWRRMWLRSGACSTSACPGRPSRSMSIVPGRFSEAIAVMNSVEDPTVCFEQPCESLEQCRAVRELTRNPIILDESIVTLGDLVQGQRQEYCPTDRVKIGRVGGLTKARQLRDFCIYHGIRMNIEDVGGTQVSDSAVMHLAASTPGRLASCQLELLSTP